MHISIGFKYRAEVFMLRSILRDDSYLHASNDVPSC
jgi:hypothetical protein